MYSTLMTPKIQKEVYKGFGWMAATEIKEKHCPPNEKEGVVLGARS